MSSLTVKRMLCLLCASACVALAGFGGGTTTLTQVSMRRQGAVVICNGECLVRSSQDDDSRLCPLNPQPQATYAACLTTLAGLCANTCKTTP